MSLAFFTLTISSFALMFTTIMFALHLYLAASGWTSWELFRRKYVWYLKGYTDLECPFGVGICNNLKYVFFNRGIFKNWMLLREIPNASSEKEDEKESKELSIFC